MRSLKGFLSVALLYSVNSFSSPTTNVFLQCENGIHAALKNHRLLVEGLFNLPFEKTNSESDQHTILVFADSSIEAKILIRHVDAKFFLQNKDSRWIPCIARKINDQSGIHQQMDNQ